MTAVPKTVGDVVDHVNALAGPVSLPCLLESLPRPLALHATRSVFSAQPAVGKRSPRIFLFFDRLVLSVALAGMGKDLLEFGEARTENRSLKAEIEFPVTEPLTHEAPYTRILYKEGQTNCAFCHSAESPDESIEFASAFVSAAYRPSRGQDYVSVAELAVELQQCDSADEPERCEMLQSLFARGMPVDHEFPSEYLTFQ
jgi:hypothetical protein